MKASMASVARTKLQCTSPAVSTLILAAYISMVGKAGEASARFLRRVVAGGITLLCTSPRP